jgi:hypothetical protein
VAVAPTCQYDWYSKCESGVRSSTARWACAPCWQTLYGTVGLCPMLANPESCADDSVAISVEVCLLSFPGSAGVVLSADGEWCLADKTNCLRVAASSGIIRDLVGECACKGLGVTVLCLSWVNSLSP